MTKGRKILVIAIVIFSVLLSTISFYVYQVLKTPNVLVQQDDRIFLIYPEATFDQVQDSLLEGDYVHDLLSFSMLAKYMDYPQSVKPGRYLLQKDMTNLEAINLLRSGNQKPVNITFNNVRLPSELGPKICQNIALDSLSFTEKILDEEFIRSYGFDSLNILSMFIPNTYEVYWDITVEELFDRMHREYEDFWNEDRLSKAQAMGLTAQQVSVLASIVNSESQKSDEHARIAGVYVNRLNLGMALQADPTLVFALGDFTIKRVLNEHKELDSPFNTYKYTGLPPGPIRSPSISAVNAVLDYEAHNYLYFCAKEDFSGYHNFASSLTQHLRNARLYQNALNRAKVYR